MIQSLLLCYSSLTSTQETGVFSAVDGGFLEAVRFFITQGGSDCSTADVLESYTLTFSYDDNAGADRSVRSISFNSTPVFTTDNAIKSFKKAIRNLLTSLQGLPTMPRKLSPRSPLRIQC